MIQEIQQIFLDLKMIRKKQPTSSVTSLYDSFLRKIQTVMTQNLAFIENILAFMIAILI